jgi:hypothetical protein
MSDTTITSANSVFTISVAGLFPAPVQLSGYSAERAWNSDAQDLAETQMGVDGRQTAGYVPAPVRQTISLQADSPSKAIFQAIARAMQASKDVFYISGTIVLPSTGEAFAGVRGVLQQIKAIADAGKVLQPVDYVIVWESLQASLS